MTVLHMPRKTAQLSAYPLVIASHNAGKVKEIAQMLASLSIEVCSAADVGADEPEETGSSFVENAEIKSRHVSDFCGYPSLADDSGLVVPALGGAPGIYSARWAGPAKDFSVAIRRIQEELKSTDTPQAYFICVLSLCMPDGITYNFEGRVDGTLTFPPRGKKGFGYDPIFIPAGHDRTFAEMDPEEKHRISHRARAFEKFRAFLEEH